MKPLDMADKYPPAESFEDDDGDRPTIKVQVPDFLPQVIVSDEGEESDLYGERDTIPSPPSYPECMPERVEERGQKSYPGLGLLIALGFGVTFWSIVTYFLFR